MGGDNNLTVSSSSSSDSSLDRDFPKLFSSFLRDDYDDGLSMKSDISGNCLETLDLKTKNRRKEKDLREILRSYEELGTPSRDLEESKIKILSYKPGAWIDNSGTTKSSDYDVPTTTSLLLVGPKGAGKSSLVNRISKVFESEEFSSDRAQETYNSFVGDGTMFLQEYMIPRSSTSFCLYDTRSLSDDPNENMEMLRSWIGKGVRHGKLVTRDSDSSSLRRRMDRKDPKNSDASYEIRKVNFVIFVVDGVSVLKSLNNDDANRLYTDVVASAFNCPYLSFRDDKPLVVVTHGDLISHYDRALIRVYLGELLGIPPTKQIFDIPDKLGPETELTIVEMLRYSLVHADKNLPPKRSLMNRMNKVISPYLSSILLLLLMIGVVIITSTLLRAHIHHGPCPRVTTPKAQSKDDFQGKAKFPEPRAKDDIPVEANFPEAQAKNDIQGQSKFPEPRANNDLHEVKFAEPEPREKYSIQVEAKFPRDQKKDDIHGQAKFPKDRPKEDIKKHGKFPKDDIKKLGKFPKDQPKEDTQGHVHNSLSSRTKHYKPRANDDIQWHEIRHLWLGDDV